MRFLKTKINKNDIAPIGFSIGYFLIFLNPIGLRNEVYPYYVIPLLLMSREKIYIIGVAATIIFAGVVGQYIIEIKRYLLDSIILTIGIVGIYMLNRLDWEQIIKIGKIFKYNIIIIFLIFLLIRAFPSFQDLLGTFFSGRGTNYEFLFQRNGSIAGIAPEPAYASLHVLTMFLFLLRTKMSSLLIELIVIAILLQAKSVYGIFFYILLHIMYPRKETLILSLCFGMIFIFYSDFFINKFERIFTAISSLFELGSLIKLENSYGSQRFTNIVNGLNFYDSEYITGFSLPVIFVQHFGFLALFLGLFIALIAPKYDYLRVFVALILTGPALLISGTIFHIGSKNK